ncbi:MAG TPA: homoserine kinase [Candidatus Baltobacteraceae bacterium]
MLPSCDPFSLSVPASSANLGSGYDAVGIALDLHMRAEVVPAAEFRLEFEPGRHAPSHDGLRRTIVNAIARVAPSLPHVAIRVGNAIPLGKGLGSSAAAVVLGLAVGARASGVTLSREQLAVMAAEIEGHPDNALAAVMGGAVIASQGERLEYVRVALQRELRALIVIPDIDLTTADSRTLLPDNYSRADALFTTGRAALLGAALASRSWKALRASMGDRLHQPFRAARIPGMEAALALPSLDALGVAISGAGPSLLALFAANAPWEASARAFEACFAQRGVAATSLWLRVGGRGLNVAAPAQPRRAA